MLALVLDGEPRLVRDRPPPQRAPGEARIRMRVCGVCDTDLQLARGYMNYRGVLGHEFVGEVVEADDSKLVGRRVVADINAGCGQCVECSERQGHHCRRRTVLGILGRDGALAEELVVPARCLVFVPDTVSDEQAVFAEPLAAAAHVLDDVAMQSSAPIVVLGDGKLGQLIARALLAEERRVVVIGHHASKLALARAAGAETYLESEVPESLYEVPVVVEATGSASGITRALSLLCPRGTLVLKTTVAGKIEVDLSAIVVNELTVVGSRCGDLQRAIELMARIDPRPLVAARYPLARAEQALEHAARPGTLKVLVENDVPS